MKLHEFVLFLDLSLSRIPLWRRKRLINKYKSREYSCKTCGKLFKFKSKLNMHELVHGGEKPHECDICK